MTRLRPVFLRPGRETPFFRERGISRSVGDPQGATSSAARAPAPRQAGFALLIVVTLLAFIVLLLLGLAVFTRVETAVAGNTQRQAQARENALLALDVALGQLQRYAGPDAAITTTAANFGGIDGTRHYTGVWSANTTVSATPATPLTWLVSGNELTQADPDPAATPGSIVAAALAITPDAPGTRTVDLIGRNTTGNATRNADYVVAPLTDITASGVPGTAPTASATIGRYAWWVGDQGVKAPVALPDTASAATFAPYDSTELRLRIRQQVPLGAGAAEAGSGTPIFEPADSNNASLVAGDKVGAFSQIAFLRTAANAQLGLARLRQNLHAWSPNNFAVLTDPQTGLLRQDLSLNPAALGAAFAAWSDYATYMELPTDANALRRRYVITPAVRDGGGSHQVGPVLSDFALTFNVRVLPTAAGNPANSVQPFEVRAACMLSLWNPYTSALVPEEIVVEIEGLPEIEVLEEATQQPVTRFSLHDAYAGGADLPIRLNLPWNNDTLPAGTSDEDRQSWLPGRIYTWRTIEDLSKGAIPTLGFPTRFYTRSFVAAGETNAGIQRPVPGSADGSVRHFLRATVATGGGSDLLVRLRVLRAGELVTIGEFVAPPFATSFDTTAQEIGKFTYQFGYVFRLKESIDTVAAPSEWLTTPNIDFRRRRVPAIAFVPDNGVDPAIYANSLTDLATAKPDRLLFRAGDGLSYNEDVPLFELPRGPILSLGALQHFRIVNSRPFMIGNPWGAGEQLNNIPLGRLFDRFFFSGLVNGMVPDTTASGDLILPNALLKPLRKSDQSKLGIDDIRALMNPPVQVDANGDPLPGPAPTASSSRYLLQSGAFNLNSTQRAAWVAVLRGVRFPTAQSAFTYLDPDPATGTAADTAVAALSPSTDAHFFRFSQSAQETYKAEPGQADNDPSNPSPARTELFRQGMRTLGETEVATLAGRIVELLALKQQDSGPFRSLEEFLAPSALFAGVDPAGNPTAPRSLLEAAIEDTGLNNDLTTGQPYEFSSRYLTQADVMTSLAPILFVRSDTFVVRTYGEAVNPATNAVEGRAWAEAVVQRLPEYFAEPGVNLPDTDPAAFDALIDPADPASGTTPTQQLNKTFGRRFKVVSFRWLTRADI